MKSIYNINDPSFDYVKLTTPDCISNLNLLHDSQASISLVKIDTIKNQKLIDTTNKVNIVGITEHKVEAIDLQIVFDEYVITHKFFVMPVHINIPVHGILGKDFLKSRFKCKIDYENETITVKLNDSYKIIPILESNQNYPPSTSQILTVSEKATDVLNELQISNPSISDDTNLTNLCSKFSHIFHSKNELLSVNNFFEYKITIKEPEPVYIKNYQTPHTQKAEIDSQVNSLLSSGQIEKSTAPYNSPILLVPKKSTTVTAAWRLCIDFRALNKKLVSDSYPLPRIDEILDGLGDNKFFSIVDLSQGFHQIPLAEESYYIQHFERKF